MKKIEAIDLFCGIGGLSYGLRQSKIIVKAGLDSDASCKYAYENNTKAEFIKADISKYDLSLLKSFYSKNCVKLLVGCTPCQPFSSHTHKIKNKAEADNRWNLISYFAKAVEILKPDVVSMENVRGLEKENIFNTFVENLKELGYHVNYKVVYCPDYGIPQTRHRLVLLGALKKNIPIPQKTHSPSNYQTVANTIDNLPSIRSGETCTSDPVHRSRNLTAINLKRIRQSKPAGSWRDWDENLLPNCYKKESGQTYASVYGRMSKYQPSPTITTQFSNYGSGRFGHPEQDRALSIREGALLQTFPLDYDFGENTSFTQVGRHIGNAVPPRLGLVIGKSILEHLENTL